MNIVLKMDGSMVIYLSPEEIDRQIDFLSSVEPKNERESNEISRLMLQVVGNKWSKS